MDDLAHKISDFLLEADEEDAESAKDFIARAAAARKHKNKTQAYGKPPLEPGEDWVVIAKQELEQSEDVELDVTDESATDAVMEGPGHIRYKVFINDDAAEREAKRDVTEMLQMEPETFDQAWLHRFINTEKLRNELHSDVYDMNYERWSEERDSRAIKELIDRGFIEEDDFFDGYYEKDLTPELQTKLDAAKEEAAESDTKSQLEDPVSYLEDIYGREAGAKAIEIAGIDYEAAANDAISTDGVAHFLAHYDLTEIDLPSGAVAYRQG